MKITGAKAVIWAVTILIGIGGVVYGVYQHDRAETYKGYKVALATEMQNHRADLKECAKTAQVRSDIDNRTIKALMERNEVLAKRLKIGRKANVTINVTQP
jgi:hypothetical protein